MRCCPCNMCLPTIPGICPVEHGAWGSITAGKTQHNTPTGQHSTCVGSSTLAALLCTIISPIHTVCSTHAFKATCYPHFKGILYQHCIHLHPVHEPHAAVSTDNDHLAQLAAYFFWCAGTVANPKACSALLNSIAAYAVSPASLKRTALAAKAAA